MKTHVINGKTYFEPEGVSFLSAEEDMRYKCLSTNEYCHRIINCKDCLFNYDKPETVKAYKSIYKKD